MHIHLVALYGGVHISTDMQRTQHTTDVYLHLTVCATRMRPGFEAMQHFNDVPLDNAWLPRDIDISGPDDDYCEMMQAAIAHSIREYHTDFPLDSADDYHPDRVRHTLILRLATSAGM